MLRHFDQLEQVLADLGYRERMLGGHSADGARSAGIRPATPQQGQAMERG
jgi:hypothetical protein